MPYYCLIRLVIYPLGRQNAINCVERVFLRRPATVLASCHSFSPLISDTFSTEDPEETGEEAVPAIIFRVLTRGMVLVAKYLWKFRLKNERISLPHRRVRVFVGLMIVF